MTTSSRMEHQHSIHSAFPHHLLQESLHSHHPFSLATSDISHNSAPSRNSNPLPPLACLSEAAAAMSTAAAYSKENHNHRLEYGADAAKKNGDATEGKHSQFIHHPPHQQQQQREYSRPNGYSRNAEGNYGNKSSYSSSNSDGSIKDKSMGESCGTSFAQDGKRLCSIYCMYLILNFFF